jgi:hypothetical protein
MLSTLDKMIVFASSAWFALLLWGINSHFAIQERAFSLK